MASLIKRRQTYYIQWYVSGRIRRRSLKTRSLQIAKEKLRQFDAAYALGTKDPFPTRIPTSDVVGAYIDHIRTFKTPKSAHVDIYYLRKMFGVICPQLRVKRRRAAAAKAKREARVAGDLRAKPPRIEAATIEEITTRDIATFITAHVTSRGLAPKTANRYREILVRLFNWATTHFGVQLAAGRNPASAIERFYEPAPRISYLTLAQIQQQLSSLLPEPALQCMVAVLIYAGLRRDELLWLTTDDVRLPHGHRGAILVRAKRNARDHWQPKTKKNRTVPISRALRQYLEAYVPAISDGRWYFPSPHGLRWDGDNFSHKLRVVNRTAGLSWSCLDYRHTFGTQLAQKGVSLYHISELMGNSPEMCRRHYAALHLDALRSDVEFDEPDRINTPPISDPPRLSIA